ncbi:hypothetical protein GCM10009546_66160 [Actinomadura livida]|uniref:Uncharacterized protein n=1 Tax=Actinomadura livida TaxID=79909 RepID=A0ABN1FNS6_9ACTN|nr:hypothetical protein GCM10010208_23840 [Actinomadura livida]
MLGSLQGADRPSDQKRPIRFRPDDSVRWVSVGIRCVADGVLGSCADWKINYEPSRHLLARV